MDKEMIVLLVRPMCPPKEVTIDGSLKTLQSMVGGTIECIYPFADRVGIVCNDEGKLLGLPPNRALRTESGQVYDIVCGDFLVVGLGKEDFCSLTPQQMSHYKDLYSREMIFSRPPHPGRGR